MWGTLVLDDPSPIKDAKQIARADSVRKALARFLKVSPDLLGGPDAFQDEAITSELSAALEAVAGDDGGPEHFSDDQRLLLSRALQLSEEEVLYLLECAANKDDGPDRVRL
jgi:hypothetical protein